MHGSHIRSQSPTEPLSRDYKRLIRLEDGEDLEYVDWLYEPRHQLLLENQWTRVYVADIPPGMALKQCPSHSDHCRRASCIVGTNCALYQGHS